MACHTPCTSCRPRRHVTLMRSATVTALYVVSERSSAYQTGLADFSSCNLHLTIEYACCCHEQVRHFALHCLERMVKERWNPNTVSTSTNGAHSGKLGQSSHPGVPSEFSLTQKQQIKDAMLQVMAFGTRDILSEAHFIKVKVGIFHMSRLTPGHTMECRVMHHRK